MNQPRVRAARRPVLLKPTTITGDSDPMRGQPEITRVAVNATRTVPGSAVPFHLVLAAVLATLLAVVAGLALESTATTGRTGSRSMPSRQATSRLPIAARGPVSDALGAHERGYRVVGLRARNPRQR